MKLQLLLNAAPDYTKPVEAFSDRISMATEMLLRGMGTIFFVLVLLWFILAIFSKVIHRDEPKTAIKAPKASKEAPKATPTPAPAVVPVAQTEDTALVAAITAAIAAYLDQPTTSFRVVSFKRTGKKK